MQEENFRVFFRGRKGEMEVTLKRGVQAVHRTKRGVRVVELGELLGGGDGVK